jgi:hypothetical protein
METAFLLRLRVVVPVGQRPRETGLRLAPDLLELSGSLQRHEHLLEGAHLPRFAGEGLSQEHALFYQRLVDVVLEVELLLVPLGKGTLLLNDFEGAGGNEGVFLLEGLLGKQAVFLDDAVDHVVLEVVGFCLLVVFNLHHSLWGGLGHVLE